MQQAENKTSKTSPGSTSSAVSRHSSVYSQLSIEKLKESQRKIELLTRAAALKERQKIEEEKLKLKIKEEELELSTEIKISDAKTKVMDELEKSIRMDENIFEETNLPLNLDAPEFKPDMERVSPPPTLPKSANPQMNSYMKPECTYSTTNIYSSNENDGLHRVTRELNKPKSEIIKFEGNPMDYNRFIRQFQTRVLNNTDSYDERMNFLLQFTTGEAHKIASGYSHLSAEVGFTATMKEFKDRYGDPDVVANEYVKKALEWSVIKADNPKALDQYSIFLKECLYAVENVEAARVLEYSENIKRIIMKLPYYLHERWRTIVYELKEKNRVVKFNNLVSFVQREAKKANDPLYGKTVMSVESHSTRAPTLNQRKPYRSFATNTSNDEHRELLPETSLSEHVVQCVYCSAEHSLNSCQDITKQPLKERYQFLRSKGLCFGCLKPGHQKSNCNRKMECHICKRPHPSILHVEPTDNEKFYTKTAATSTGAGIRQVLPIVPVKIKSKSSSKVVETYAFLDTGSTSTFCSESLLSKLNVLGKGHKVTIQTITERQTRDCLAVTGLEILSLDENEVIDLPKIYSQTKLPVTIADRITKSELEKWPHLKNVELPTIDQSNCDVELLIGVDVPRALEPWDVIPSVDNSPFAVKTLFGWAVNGPIDYSDVDAECLNAFSVTCNFIQTSLDQQVRNNFNLDFSERVIDDVPEHSCEDKRFLEIVAGSARFENGHYVMNLPFKSKDIQMPNNRQVAIHRLSLLGKRFKGDAEFQGQYGDFMNKMMENGYARKVPSRDLTQNDGCVWYLPHHGVFHPKKNKIRVVFDCAARFQGRSLNEELLQGPNLTNTLIGTLIRFREEQVAIMGDIDSMFYQVRVPECDASLLRFLWWEDGDINKHIVEYQMMVHLFGARSSPSCANYALKRTVQDRSDDIDEEIADTVMKNFYVDDCLKSVDTVDHAKSVVKGLQKALSQGGFHISKWLSNSREVMQAVPASDRAKEIQDLDLDQDVLPIDRALGVQWNVESDMFCFKVHLKERPLTRRGMLSMISSVYDPLGFLAPFMLQAKNLLKDLCRLGLGWDDPVPEKVVERWYLWLNDVEKLSDFSVTRCLKPSLFGKITSAVLHHFSDASESGYGIVTYLRLVDSDERVHCSFVIGKSRVAPLKQVTIPRLELTAATVAVRTDRMVKSEIDIPLNDSVFWTDSMSVLRYIMNTTSRFHTFVANRLSVIHEGSNPDQWRYVSTKLNPADIASRGIPATDLSRHWIEAPEFLWKSILPETTIQVSDSLLDDDPEVKKINFVKSVTNNVTFESIEEDPIHKLILHYSSWLRLKRAVAWILKVRAKLLQRVKCKSSSQSHFSGDIDRGCPDITVHDLNLAEIIVISYTQKNAFPEEIATLASGKYKLKRDSSIRNLDPVLDDGLLRVGGRFKRVMYAN
ncbi:uncharacterized protein LOC123526762 [Mercenaria mercenaria]|uniref:uncharacterized protein LOC123526762 n=1 Tax=Mercenaria mercenaria TaxID=6596 RepID=UPI00234F94D7|nr:uncharacterized protein LOC123526762 [Mercenaria mercenaria]